MRKYREYKATSVDPIEDLENAIDRHYGDAVKLIASILLDGMHEQQATNVTINPTSFAVEARKTNRFDGLCSRMETVYITRNQVITATAENGMLKDLSDVALPKAKQIAKVLYENNITSSDIGTFPAVAGIKTPQIGEASTDRALAINVPQGFFRLSEKIIDGMIKKNLPSAKSELDASSQAQPPSPPSGTFASKIKNSDPNVKPRR